MILQYRPISEVIRVFVLPEINKRLQSETLNSQHLPIELSQFRAYQIKEDRKIVPVVQLNDEVGLLKVRTKPKDPKKKIETGQVVEISDIKCEECFIYPPEYKGKPCGYFYFNRIFLEPWMCFDLNANLPNISEEELKELRIKLPVDQWVKERDFIKVVRPYEKLDLLVSKNWPPAPCYFPHVYAGIHKDESFIGKPEFLVLLTNLVNENFWNKRLKFCGEIGLFPKRIEYVQKAIELHMSKDYIAAIFVICPQFEGILREYLELNQVRVSEHYKDNLNAFKDLIFGRKLLLYPKKFISIIFDYLENGSFWSHTSQIQQPDKMINRHGILHGVFSQFESEELSLKFLMLLDSLIFILLSDRLANGSV